MFSFTRGTPFLLIQSDHEEPRILHYLDHDFSKDSTSNNNTTTTSTSTSGSGTTTITSTASQVTPTILKRREKFVVPKRKNVTFRQPPPVPQRSNNRRGGVSFSPLPARHSNKRRRLYHQEEFDDQQEEEESPEFDEEDEVERLPYQMQQFQDFNSEEEENDTEEEENRLLNSSSAYTNIPPPQLSLRSSPGGSSSSSSIGINYSPYQILGELPLSKKQKKRKRSDLLSDENLELVKSRDGKEWIAFNGAKGTFIPNFKEPDKRTVIYMTGPTGQGKTHLASRFMKYYHEFFPNYDVNVFNRDPEDKTFFNAQCFDHKIINCTDKILDDNGKEVYDMSINPLTPEDLENSCCLFDDIQYIADPKLCKIVTNLCQTCLGDGRKRNITTIVTGQIPTDYSRTRLLLNEAEWILFFPHSSISRGLEYLFQHYLGLKSNNPLLKRMLNAPCRWVIMHVRSPQFAFHETGAFMFK